MGAERICMQDLKHWIWLSKIDICPQRIQNFLKQYETEDIWNLKKEIKQYFTNDEIERMENKKYRQNLELHEQYLLKNKIELVTIKDKDYPLKLKNIEGLPICLYAFGNKELLSKKSIAIIGSRECSEYGKNISQAFSYLLAKKDITIISGLAKGIDSAAHLGTLQAEGNTVAVIGTGIDFIYPKENKGLMKKIIEKGGLIVSEYPLGTKPEKENFPRRNRLISGLSDGVLVIEAREKSGALITVDYALDQGKNVYVIPREHYQ